MAKQLEHQNDEKGNEDEQQGLPPEVAGGGGEHEGGGGGGHEEGPGGGGGQPEGPRGGGKHALWVASIAPIATVLVALIGGAVTIWITSLKVKDTNATTEKLQQNAALGGPIGSIVAYAGDVSDLPKRLPGWRACDGSVLPRRDFQELYDRLNLAWGGDSDNVKLPDLQGLFLRGVDNNAGRDPDAAGREPAVKGGKNHGGDVVGTIQPDALKEHTHAMSLWVYYMYKDWPTFAPGPSKQVIGGVLPGEKRDQETFQGPLNDAGTVKPEKVGGKETRPKNASVYWIIRVSYEGAEKNASTKS